MDFLNILGAIAFILTIIALLCLRKQMSIGWIIFLPSYAIQIAIFLITKQWFLVCQMVMLIILSGINFIEWEKKKHESSIN